MIFVGQTLLKWQQDNLNSRKAKYLENYNDIIGSLKTIKIVNNAICLIDKYKHINGIITNKEE